MKKSAYTIGLDYGTNSLRCLIVNVVDGTELVCITHNFPSGECGVLLDHTDDKLARQNPVDYNICTEMAIRQAIKKSGEID